MPTMSAPSRTRSIVSSVIIWSRPRRWSFEVHHGDAGAPLVPQPEAEPLRARLLAEQLGHALAERAGPLPVDDPQRPEVGADRLVDGAEHVVVDLVDAHPAQVDLGGRVDLGDVAEDRDVDLRLRD